MALPNPTLEGTPTSGVFVGKNRHRPVNQTPKMQVLGSANQIPMAP